MEPLYRKKGDKLYTAADNALALRILQELPEGYLCVYDIYADMPVNTMLMYVNKKVVIDG